MSIPLSKGIRAPAEQIFRSLVKHHFLNAEPPAAGPPPTGRFGCQRVLPPYLGEMGFEIRYQLARAEPWLNNGWKIVTRRPALYPEGTTLDAPEFFAAVDDLLGRYNAVGSHGAIHIPPLEQGVLDFVRDFQGTSGAITISLSDVRKVTAQALVEIELRRLFLDWFYFDGRAISDFDRYNLSFASTAVGNWEYHCGTALRPGFLPPSFMTPPEPMPPHVGVQLRNVANGWQQKRNSDPARMLATANDIARHLGLDVLVYGHPDGCHIPQCVKTTWNPARPDGHMARELGYLKSCRFMLSPDSGWADLMAWLMVPTLLEMVHNPGAYEQLRASFGGRMRPLDPDRAPRDQADALLGAGGNVLPDACSQYLADARLFPWEP